jgi:hypothetical protein
MKIVYRLELSPLPDSSDSTGIRRLRAALKVLLRRFGLRCVWLTEGPPTNEHETNRPQTPETEKTRQPGR